MSVSIDRWLAAYQPVSSVSGQRGDCVDGGVAATEIDEAGDNRGDHTAPRR